MFIKRKLNKVDLLSGINETEVQDNNQDNLEEKEAKITKKVKKNIIEGHSTQGNFN